MARILIAEDDSEVRALVVRALAAQGHEITAAEDGGAALDILSREDGGFDLLLSDIQMPVMDGIALALAAARDFPSLPILLMTGYADQRERAHGLDAIVREVLSKPFTLPELRAAVAAVLAPAG
ncbi:MAG: response regulator [Methylacidiphilales bacterium]|nr:response regulator [Candidatus Methylacidiphilales bacterium]